MGKASHASPVPGRRYSPEAYEHGSPDIRAGADRLVIGGIIAETLFSVLLFTYDANVIGVQNDKIIVLEKHLLPRQLDVTLFGRLMEDAPSAPATIIYPRDDLESGWLALSVYSALRKAHWDPELPTPVWKSRGLPRMLDDEPVLTQWGGSPVGITIVMDSLPSTAELKAEKMPPEQVITGAGRGAYSMLARALRWSVKGTNHAGDIAPMLADDVPHGALRIVIGPRPPLLPQQLEALESPKQ